MHGTHKGTGTPFAFGFAAALAALLLFATLATQVAHGQTFAFDQSIREAVRGSGTPALTTLMRGLTVVGQPLALLVLSVAGSLVFCRMGWRQGAALLLATGIGAVLLGAALKLTFQRARPEAFFHDAASGYGFPSGHALVSTATLAGMAMLAASRVENTRIRAAIWITALTVAGAIGLSRVYLGVHYPSDVLAGYAVGAIWAWSVIQAGQFLQRRYSRDRCTAVSARG
ncbi:MAG TPA: phosphatase PAP2 family protein [Bryobacteraceae bacterium]|nr:phosphatase PAP2 family protein [Bryobacteraceae bacterium]